MSKIFIGALGFALLAAPAMAADLPARMPVKAPPPVPVYSWTGFYIGGNVGHSWGRANDSAGAGSIVTNVFRTASGPADPTAVITTTPLAFPGRRINVDGIIGGGQIGYNWQISAWVWGLESDFQGSGQRGSQLSCVTAGCPAGSLFVNESIKLEWFGTTRARAGYLITPELLLYATGGAAYGELKSNATAGIIGGAALVGSASSTRVGWTAGAGGEWAFDRKWSLKLEYLYIDLGRFNGVAGASTTTTVANVPLQGFSTQTTVNFPGVRSKFTDHILRAGVNYRF